ncbi:MAG: hypothetical protein ACREEB_10665 [Caulobacteraceae bacterium]
MIASSSIGRAASFFYLQRFKGFSPPDAPHFDPASTALFKSLLTRARRYLEFGAGGSTVMAAELGVGTLSVESDPFYARAVRRRLPTTAPVKFVVVDIGLTKAWGTPVFQTPTPGRLARWKRYVDLPFERLGALGGPFPDLILVDGRFRRACALESARQAALANQTTTLFFDDYLDRPHYHDIERHLGPPRMAGRAAVFELGRRGGGPPRHLVEEVATDFR